ncbi:efflux RND transporter periplasmic adaptor subunit [Candidatus Methylocalor cossyra]|uniref:RND family efflux transporter MFP subunit n=1 Tax=Candidatus Methylocalor cossyra TaxID=3108543 RepID=A0ABM9NN51_9GAMM
MASAQRVTAPVLGLVLAAALLLRLWPDGLTGEPAPLVSVSAPTSPGGSVIVAEARVTAYPGAEVVVGSELAGTLLKVPVKEGDRVHKGQLLAELRADDTRAAIAEAEARRQEADADVWFYELEAQRAEKLWQERAGSRQILDRTLHDLAAARARRERAAADGRRWQAILEKARILAPIGGVILERHAHPGESLKEGAPIVTLADLDRRRIEAEVDEFDVGRVRLGMPVTITAEGYEGQSWRGRVEEIPDQVVLRRIKPQDPARPTDTRVLLVKVAFSEPTPLKLGQRVEVRMVDDRAPADQSARSSGGSRLSGEP